MAKEKTQQSIGMQTSRDKTLGISHWKGIPIQLYPPDAVVDEEKGEIQSEFFDIKDYTVNPQAQAEGFSSTKKDLCRHQVYFGEEQSTLHDKVEHKNITTAEQFIAFLPTMHPQLANFLACNLHQHSLFRGMVPILKTAMLECHFALGTLEGTNNSRKVNIKVSPNGEEIFITQTQVVNHYHDISSEKEYREFLVEAKSTSSFKVINGRVIPGPIDMSIRTRNEDLRAKIGVRLAQERDRELATYIAAQNKSGPELSTTTQNLHQYSVVDELHNNQENIGEIGEEPVEPTVSATNEYSESKNLAITSPIVDEFRNWQDGEINIGGTHPKDYDIQEYYQVMRRDYLDELSEYERLGGRKETIKQELDYISACDKKVQDFFVLKRDRIILVTREFKKRTDDLKVNVEQLNKGKKKIASSKATAESHEGKEIAENKTDAVTSTSPNRDDNDIIIDMEVHSEIGRSNALVEEQVSLPYVSGTRVSHPVSMAALRKVRNNSAGMYGEEENQTDILHPHKKKEQPDPFIDLERGLRVAGINGFKDNTTFKAYLEANEMESLEVKYSQGIARPIAHLLSQAYNKSSSFKESARVSSEDSGVVFPIPGIKGFRATGISYGLTLPIEGKYGMPDNNPAYHIPGEIFTRAKNSSQGGAEIISVRTSNQLLKAILEYTPMRNADGSYTYSSLEVYGQEIIDDKGSLNKDNLVEAIRFAQTEEAKSKQELEEVLGKIRDSNENNDALKNIFALTEAHRIKPGTVDENGEIVHQYDFNAEGEPLTYTLDTAMAIAIFRDLPLVLKEEKKLADCPALIDAMVWCGDPELSTAIRDALGNKVADDLIAQYGSGNDAADLAQAKIDQDRQYKKARQYYVDCLKAYKKEIVQPSIEGEKESGINKHPVIKSGIDFLRAADSAVKQGEVNKDDLITIFEFQSCQLHDCMEKMNVKPPEKPASLKQSAPDQKDCINGINRLAKRNSSLAAKAFVAVGVLLGVVAVFTAALTLSIVFPPLGFAIASSMVPAGPTLLTATTAAIATLGYVASVAIGFEIEGMHQERGLKTQAPKAVKEAINANKEASEGYGSAKLSNYERDRISVRALQGAYSMTGTVAIRQKEFANAPTSAIPGADPIAITVGAGN